MKVRVDEALEKKARIIFSSFKNKQLLTGQGLTRKELRALERAGFVTSSPANVRRHWADSDRTLTRLWKWNEEGVAVGKVKQ